MSQSSLMKAVRGLVFDLDGTLIDSYEAIAESLNSALVSFGHQRVAVEEVKPMVGRGLEVLIERALTRAGDSDPAGRVDEAITRFRKTYDAICVEATTLLPGVAPTLAELSRRGFPMAVATNKPSYFARRLVDALGVGGHIAVVLGPDLVSHPKPHPGMVHKAIEVMGIAASETLYVGDMAIDLETARAAGVEVAVMPTGSCTIEQLRDAGADRVIPDFASLLTLLPSRCPGR